MKTNNDNVITRLPWGFGSLQKRRANWWMVYRDAQDVMVQENSGTDNREEALRMLAKRALERVAVRVAVLKTIADGTTEVVIKTGKRKGGQPAGARKKRQTGKGSVPKNSPRRGGRNRRPGSKGETR
jgi:hypothetical protein